MVEQVSGQGIYTHNFEKSLAILCYALLSYVLVLYVM